MNLINKKYNINKNERIALTFGDAGENHVGMEMVGKLGKKGSGYTPSDLKLIKKYIETNNTNKKGFNNNVKTEIINMNYKNEYASVLIIRNYIDEYKQYKIFEEMDSFEWDSKYWDNRRKKVLNKHARKNVVFVDNKTQKPNFEKKKGTIINTKELKHLFSLKKNLISKIKNSLKESKTKSIPLIIEGNRYFDLKKCGIGYHGDSERTRVICLSIGSDNYPMQWQWFKNSKPIGEPYKVYLNSGDIYIMSEKAVGQEWKKRSIFTLRHAAGAKKYISLDKYKN